MKMNQFDTIKHLRFKSRLSQRSLERLKDRINSFRPERPRDALFHAVMEWEPKNGEIMLYTDYCSQGFELPTTFNSMIQTNKSEIIVPTKVFVPFAVLNGLAAINEIAMGHRHACLLQFDGHIPEMVRNLPELNDIVQTEYDIILFDRASNNGLTA
jgi:hypothetical protein